ncbi:heme exporter protein CcmD [Vreelandella malpeensis]|uniref:Heme exporter protein D n=1 Tax=Vreelandella malpeensis TaxID=1172368 RepID=A0ABS8DRL8_9GAMM|nr:heme exporter protein CcmD [Halomonas malpeensis]MCB8888924.1 heme exporter protein CcmD [Halomonas malpeensis]
MAFTSLQEFFAMGGHGVYVWAAWGVTAALFAASLLQARLERRALLKTLSRRVRRDARRRQTTDPAHSSRPMVDDDA